MEHLSRNILFLRKLKNFKQSEMYDKLAIHRTTWNNYESGVSVPILKDALRIAKFFDVNLEDLLTRDFSTNTHLIGKTDDAKKQQNAHLITHPNAHLTAEKKENKDTLILDKNAFNHLLNEDGAVYPSLKAQVQVLSNNIAKLEANMSKRIAKMEDKIDALEKGRSKK